MDVGRRDATSLKSSAKKLSREMSPGWINLAISRLACEFDQVLLAYPECGAGPSSTGPFP